PTDLEIREVGESSAREVSDGDRDDEGADDQLHGIGIGASLGNWSRGSRRADGPPSARSTRFSSASIRRRPRVRSRSGSRWQERSFEAPILSFRSFSLRGSVHERGHHGFQRAPPASSNAASVAPVKNTYRQLCLRICPSPSSLFRSREDAPFAPTAPSGDRPLFTSAESSVVMDHLPRPKGPQREAPPGFAGGRLASWFVDSVGLPARADRHRYRGQAR